MWILFGIIVLIATLMNWVLYLLGKEFKFAMAIALSFTTLTLCAEYSAVSQWVMGEDWSALIDVVPTMNQILWLFAIGSNLINLFPLFLTNKRT